jgi:hypothetical protein
MKYSSRLMSRYVFSLFKWGIKVSYDKLFRSYKMMFLGEETNSVTTS